VVDPQKGEQEEKKERGENRRMWARLMNLEREERAILAGRVISIL